MQANYYVIGAMAIAAVFSMIVTIWALCKGRGKQNRKSGKGGAVQ